MNISRAALLVVIVFAGCATVRPVDEDDPKRGIAERVELLRTIEAKAPLYWEARQQLDWCVREQGGPANCLTARRNLQQSDIIPACEQFWLETTHVAPHCPCPVKTLVGAGYRYH